MGGLMLAKSEVKVVSIWGTKGTRKRRMCKENLLLRRTGGSEKTRILKSRARGGCTNWATRSLLRLPIQNPCKKTNRAGLRDQYNEAPHSRMCGGSYRRDQGGQSPSEGGGMEPSLEGDPQRTNFGFRGGIDEKSVQIRLGSDLK